jgi:diaminopimelate decarboxylase
MTTPYVIWDLKELKEILKCVVVLAKRYNVQLLFPVKAFPNKKVLSVFSKFGFGFDCSNKYELKLVTGLDEKAVISVTGPMLSKSCAASATYIDVDSENQLSGIDHNKNFGIRLNFNKQNGFAPSRFGISDIDSLKTYHAKFGNRIRGIHLHITDTKDNKFKIPKILRKCAKILSQLDYVNIGGSYDEFSLSEVENLIKGIRKFTNTQILLEMGGWYFKDIGKLYAKIIEIKPMFENRKHITLNVSKHIHCSWANMVYKSNASASAYEKQMYRVYFFGPTCAENDFIETIDTMDEFRIGDILEFSGISCYSYGFNNSFNGIPKIKHYYYE